MMTRQGRIRSRSIAIASLLVIALLASGVATDHTRAAASTDRVRQMLALTNEDRSEHDRRALALNARISRYAERHSRAMAEAGELFHTPNLADRLGGLNWSLGGENVGVGASLADLQDAFMASPPHRRNILERRFDHAAIGIVQSDGNFWVTVIFYG
jgi:uncharacterized protein YkwD